MAFEIKASFKIEAVGAARISKQGFEISIGMGFFYVLAARPPSHKERSQNNSKCSSGGQNGDVSIAPLGPPRGQARRSDPLVGYFLERPGSEQLANFYIALLSDQSQSVQKPVETNGSQQPEPH